MAHCVMKCFFLIFQSQMTYPLPWSFQKIFIFSYFYGTYIPLILPKVAVIYTSELACLEPSSWYNQVPWMPTFWSLHVTLQGDLHILKIFNRYFLMLLDSFTFSPFCLCHRPLISFMKWHTGWSKITAYLNKKDTSGHVEDDSF